jgi:hypothetical protein
LVERVQHSSLAGNKPNKVEVNNPFKLVSRPAVGVSESSDLSQVDLWTQSLERSRTRRARSQARTRQRPVELRRLAPVGIGGISAAALLVVGLPSVLGGRTGSQHAQQIAFRTPSSSRPVVSAGVYHRLTTQAPISKPVARKPSGITTRTTQAGPSQHFVSTAPRPASRPVPRRSAPEQTTSTSAHSATPTHHKTAPAHSSATPRTEFLSARAGGHSSGSGGSGGGGIGAGTPAPRHHHSSHHASSSGNARSGSSSHSSSSSSRHSSSSSSHRSASGGGGIGGQSGSSSKHNSGSGPSGYVNPLADAKVTPERIDQGVDYSGSGALNALGDGQITYVGTSGTGWPGAFIEFRLLGGPDAGRYVYYAEDVTPAQGLHVGQRVSAGQKLATIYQGGSGIEVGWGANRGTETYAAAHGGWTSSQDSNNVATSAGKSFSALLSSLGAPPGKVEG